MTTTPETGVIGNTGGRLATQRWPEYSNEELKRLTLKQDSGSGETAEPITEDDDVDYRVLIVKSATHYVRVANSRSAIMLALAREPDAEEMDVTVTIDDGADYDIGSSSSK